MSVLVAPTTSTFVGRSLFLIDIVMRLRGLLSLFWRDKTRLRNGAYSLSAWFILETCYYYFFLLELFACSLFVMFG